MNLDESEPLMGKHSSEGRTLRDVSGSGKHGKVGVEKRPVKLTKERFAVVLCILLTELCERLTYYSVMANLVLFCTSVLKFSSVDASNVSLVFAGTVYVIPVFGGYVADAIAGKYNTIFGAGLIYLLGLFLLPASAVDYTDWFGYGYNLSVDGRRAYFLVGLAFIAIGTGGIKANVAPFGAQQVEDLGPEAVQSFFNWFYWFINAGSFIAYSAVAYIQQEISFSIGFLVPFLSMILSLLIFVIAKARYANMPAGGSNVPDAISVCCSAAKGCRGFYPVRKSIGGEHEDSLVNGVICLLRVLPVFLLIIMYWAIYSQMNTTFFLQSERMDISIGDANMPVAVLNVFNTVIILILIPIMDRGVYPLLAKFGKHPTHLQRIAPWFPDDINDGKTEYLFFLLGGLMIANFFVFILVAMKYKYREPEVDTEETYDDYEDETKVQIIKDMLGSRKIAPSDHSDKFDMSKV